MIEPLSRARWQQWLCLPRGVQAAAVAAWLEELGDEPEKEAWNQAFSDGSLFDAWTRTSVVRGLYAANRRILQPHLADLADWTAVEIGVGDARLWTEGRYGSGTLIGVDPSVEVHRVAADRLPAGVAYTPRADPVEHTLDDAALWADLDVVVCSLTLHHLAGADEAQRGAHGLSGPGKVEVLTRIRRALRPDGLLLVNEADVYCDLGLASGDLLLEDQLMDSYVRRCAGSVLTDVETRTDADGDLRARWRAIVRHWCLEQLRYAHVPAAQRDVYELDVARWLDLFDRAGLRVEHRGFTDAARLFHQYVLRPA